MAQLKISDLSVGDWGSDKNGIIAQIRGIECWSDGYVINVQTKAGTITNLTEAGVCPIPITPEILVQNGFEVYDDTARLKLDRPHALWLFKEQEGWDLHLPSREQHINLQIEYVHQLQHALRLAGIEKEIGL
jgi:hypothetical protein